MEHILDKTGLAYFWGKIQNLLHIGTAWRAQSIPFGAVDSTSTATAFTATVDGITELDDGVCCYLKNTVVTSAAASTTPKCFTLNINGLGAKPVYQVTAAASYATTHFTKNYKYLFTYDSSLNSGDGGWYIGQIFNSNTTYSDMTQAEVDAGTGTTGRKITPKMLRDNFYTEDEVDNLIEAITPGDENVIETVKVNGTALTPDANKAVNIDLSGKANKNGSDSEMFIAEHFNVNADGEGIEIKGTCENDRVTLIFSDSIEGNNLSYTFNSGEYERTIATTNDIPAAVTESTVSGWGFTKNTGTYSKPSGGIPKTDLASAVQTSLGKADTALQSFTETDPTVPAWAKAANKPSYTAAEVGALPDTTTIPAAPGTLNTTATTAQSTSSSEALSGSVTLHKVAKTGTYNDLIGKPTIPTVPTNVSAFTNDAGYTTNTGTITGITMNGASKGTSGVVDLGTVLTAHQDISGKVGSTTVHTIVSLTEAEYTALSTKDSSALYIITS